MNLKKILLTGALALATSGCNDKPTIRVPQGPQKGDPITVVGKIVELSSPWAESGLNNEGYAKKTKDITIVGEGTTFYGTSKGFYHISTTGGPSKWRGFEVGDSVQVGGQYAGNCHFVRKYVCAINVSYADLEMIKKGGKK